ncbi:hypothetical protein IAR50_002826 [Cryptococcus sp. DSM 104548]
MCWCAASISFLSVYPQYYLQHLYHIPPSCVVLRCPFSPRPTHSFKPRANADLPGTFVQCEDLDKCPVLSQRDTPTSAKDVRPDDIRVVMALGDSITAGLLAHPASSPWSLSNITTHFRTSDVEGYRGISYPSAIDEGAITIPTILSYFVPNSTIEGSATGQQVMFTPPSIPQVGLNAAVPAAISPLL